VNKYRTLLNWAYEIVLPYKLQAQQGDRGAEGKWLLKKRGRGRRVVSKKFTLLLLETAILCEIELILTIEQQIQYCIFDNQTTTHILSNSTVIIPSVAFDAIHCDSGGLVNILGGDNIGHCKKRS